MQYRGWAILYSLATVDLVESCPVAWKSWHSQIIASIFNTTVATRLLLPYCDNSTTQVLLDISFPA